MNVEYFVIRNDFKPFTFLKKMRRAGAFSFLIITMSANGYSFASGFVFHKTCAKVVLQAVASTNVATKNKKKENNFFREGF